MSYEKVTQADEVLIGTKQTLKAIEHGTASEIIVAADAAVEIQQRILKAANESSVSIQFVDSMKKLGKACGIDVGAATIALKKQ
ncbi:L7Ae/L30e/S12e/Gadd45 family protein [Marinococcus halophilus]|uniref:RNA-binding protein MHA01_26210 n=1 Tax=Marinococcus halophilus TaxID=1371 RepID=A0A510Y8M4_MARHA|nr:50S ribosomal protein L7ae-like protein [Marinococcus halophilus]OZT79296.1 L7Ae/L30e/S12e/Gadd45 family protein [Marinococcus halophilus]GEK59716.1 ribosome-associated protein L7Ae-like [Marinococcus halophilus]